MKKEKDYELMSHSELAKMREEIARLRSQVPTSAMSVSMEELADSIQEMNKLFKAAVEEMKEEDLGEDIAKQLEPIANKLDTVIDQNHKIANAILTVVDLVNGFVADAKKQQEELKKAIDEIKASKKTPTYIPMAQPTFPERPETSQISQPTKPVPPPSPPPMPPSQAQPPKQMPPPGMPLPPKKKRSLFEAFK
ncbi:hypothetical protein DRJ17_04195 [Candidatus Woesearchaeota archaeon]|nr:MAG: hypothetical protein DRJ17_04195 [Candidatus Woesearchaeota archaeon]